MACLALAAMAGWAIPALAGTGHPAARPAAAAAKSSTTATTTTATSTGTTGTGTSTKATTTKARVKAAPTPNYVGLWSKPFLVQRPVSSDLIPPLLALAGNGGLGVSAGTTDENNLPSAKANLVLGTPNAFSGRQVVTGAQQTLALDFQGTNLDLLTGTSPQYDSCCSTAGVETALGGGRFSGVHQVASGLLGNSTGALITVHSGLLAVVANEAGVWVAREAGGSFGDSDQLTGANQTPPLMAATPLATGGAVVAWTAGAGGAVAGTGTSTTPSATTTTSTTSATASQTFPTSQEIYYATVPVHTGGLPVVAKLALTVPSNKQIDAISLAEHNDGATVAWTESWFTSAGTYASQVFWADLNGRATTAHALSSTTTAAVGVSLASGTKGQEVLTWQACDTGPGTCEVEAALRPHGGGWGTPMTLGPVDPTSFPVSAESKTGASLVGWIDDGDVYTASAGPKTTVFHPPVEISKTADATGLQVGFASNSAADAIWQEGVLHPEIAGAAFDPLTYTRTVTTATGAQKTVTTATTPAPTTP